MVNTLSKLKFVVSNPGLGSHVRQTVRAYYDADLLQQFYTTFLLPNNTFHTKLSDKYKALKSKQFKEIPSDKIKKILLPEMLRLASSKFLSGNTTDKIWEWSEHLFDNWVANQLDKSIDVFHGYEHASLFSLQKCKSERIFSVYEQPSAHHLFVKENVISPLLKTEEFFKNNYKELYDSDLSIKRNNRRDAELELADLIVCNSSYVKKTLVDAGVLASKILVHPLGFPEVKYKVIPEKTRLRFIVSGNLSYLKGTHHVLRVWKTNAELFQNHELVCIGTDTLSDVEWKNLPDNVKKMNRLNSDDYLKELEKADVCILNTYSDGFGMVMSEAMSHGLAVIGTENSAAVDILQNDITGKVIPVGDEKSLLKTMKWMIENPRAVVSMRNEAMQYAKMHSWNQYRLDLPMLIEERYSLFNKNA